MNTIKLTRKLDRQKNNVIHFEGEYCKQIFSVGVRVKIIKNKPVPILTFRLNGRQVNKRDFIKYNFGMTLGGFAYTSMDKIIDYCLNPTNDKYTTIEEDFNKRLKWFYNYPH